MRQDCWSVKGTFTHKSGLLIHPEPVLHLDALDALPITELRQVESIAADLSWLLKTRRLRPTIEDLPVIDLSPLEPHLDSIDSRLLARLMQIYGFLASAYVHTPEELDAHHLPAGIAVPLVQLGAWLERPPILAYCDYVLSNWQRINDADAITVDNLTPIQNFIGGKDESWFILTHADIEARAAEALNGLLNAAMNVENGSQTLELFLNLIPPSIDAMIASFNRMTEGCDPEVYYQQVRPYNFGFTDVIYEGVAAFDGKPQNFRGQSGAQSSVIPALVAGLGIEHEANSMTHHLEVMHAYMPKPHRDFITQMKSAGIRKAVIKANSPSLSETYNECLRKALAFRQQHLHFVGLYVAQRVTNPLGTGGTVFMDWLSQMADETERQMI